MEKKGTWTCIARRNDGMDTLETNHHPSVQEAMTAMKNRMHQVRPRNGTKYTLIAWETTTPDVKHQHPYIH